MLSFIGFSVIVIAIVVSMTLKNNRELHEILEGSIRSQLISTSIAARGILDADRFDSYNQKSDTEDDADFYFKTLGELRELQKQVGAEYIYALKYIDGKYRFIFDTDEEEDTRFEEYDLSTVHERAFLGEESAGIMNVIDEYGSFNTGAVPIIRNGKTIGIICTDIMDVFVHDSNAAALRNAAALVVTLAVILAAMAVIMALLLRFIRKVQDKLFRMASYDVLTGLPNRQYLMSYLPTMAERALKKQAPFAFLLIDLDNFKRVNDSAGHDAGDELLRHIAAYLDDTHKAGKSFRPQAGALNVSARIGGDEFVQIVPNVKSEIEAEAVAKKLLENFHTAALDRYVEKYQVGMSVGVALFPYHTENFNVLIKYADVAMYHAKRKGKNTFFIYSDEMNQMDDSEQPENSTTGRRKNRSK